MGEDSFFYYSLRKKELLLSGNPLPVSMALLNITAKIHSSGALENIYRDNFVLGE